MSSCVFISRINTYAQRLCSLNLHLETMTFSKGHTVCTDTAVLTMKTTVHIIVPRSRTRCLNLLQARVGPSLCFCIT